MAARGNHSGAVAELDELPAARLRILGPDHPGTLDNSDAINNLQTGTA